MATMEQENQPQDITKEQAIEFARSHRDQLLKGIELLDKLSDDATDEDYAELQDQMDELAPDVSRLAWGHKYFIRYAYGFRRLNLLSDSMHLVDQCGFEDLLISQLNTEVQELISRGLRRAYIVTSERLSSPRGRIDLTRMALDGGTFTATLPCLHHPPNRRHASQPGLDGWPAIGRHDGEHC